MNIDLHGFGPAMMAGTLMTVKLALCALLLGLVLGLLGALAKTSPFKPLQWLGGFYSTLVRGVPELLWVLLIYFGTVGLMNSLGEALNMLGLSKGRILSRIILPQMWRIALPGLGNLFMILMKDTALVSVIGLEEIMRHSQIGVTVTKEPFTFYMVAACIYLGLTVLAMTGMHFMEKRAARGFARAE